MVKIIEPPQLINGYVTVVVKRADGTIEELCHNKHNVLLNEGRDQMHNTIYTDISDAIATRNPFNFIGLSNDTGTPVATNTRTTWELIEITTNGLQRTQATTRTHTTGTNVSTLSHSFTLSGTELLVQKACLLDRVATGTGIAGHENTFTVSNLFVGDQIIVTWTILLG